MAGTCSGALLSTGRTALQSSAGSSGTSAGATAFRSIVEGHVGKSPSVAIPSSSEISGSNVKIHTPSGSAGLSCSWLPGVGASSSSVVVFDDGMLAGF